MKIIYAPQYNLRKISNTCQRLYPDVETRERKDKHREDVMRCGVIPMQFHFITYGMELYIQTTVYR